MRRRLGVFLTVALVPTAVDIGLVVVLRHRVGLPLVVADPIAIAVASFVSYGLHRATTFRRTPYRRWVRTPVSFVVIALGALVVDTLVLRLAFVATGFDTLEGLLAAKTVSLTLAAVVRAVGYRFVLDEIVRHTRHPAGRPMPTSTHRLSVVVPAFRERDRIGDTVRAIRDELHDLTEPTPGEPAGVEIVVVDDGSGDGTADAAMAAGADQVIELAANRGKGGAVRAGMLAARGRTVAFIDADLAYHPSHLRALLDVIEAGWDVAIGNRRHPESDVIVHSGLRAMGSRVVNALSSAVLLAAPLDTQCGLKAFRADVARSIFARTRLDGFSFDIEVLHLVERDEWSLVEIPVRLRDDGGPSTVHVVRDAWRLLWDLLRVRRWSSLGVYEDPSPVGAEPGRLTRSG